MVRVSLTNFLDFSAANGGARITQVRKMKRQDAEQYNPATDYWRPLRHAIQEECEVGWRGKDSLAALRSASADAKKQDRYEECIKGFGRWAGRRELGKSVRRQAVWSFDELEIGVNPELDLSVNGKRTAIKLYFRADPLRKRRVDTVLYLLSQTVPKATPAVLDVPRGRLILPTVSIADQDIILESEAVQLLVMWRRLGG